MLIGESGRRAVYLYNFDSQIGFGSKTELITEPKQGDSLFHLRNSHFMLCP